MNEHPRDERGFLLLRFQLLRETGLHTVCVPALHIARLRELIQGLHHLGEICLSLLGFSRGEKFPMTLQGLGEPLLSPEISPAVSGVFSQLFGSGFSAWHNLVE